MGGCIIVDTRQKAGKHVHKHEEWERMGITLVRSKLPVGDYAKAPSMGVLVDTKQNIQELYSDLIQQHRRFRDECALAQTMGSQLWVLVENEDGVTDLDGLAKWRNPRFAIAKKAGRKMPVSSRQLASIAATMNDKYDVVFDFCAPDEAALRVLEILDGRRAREWRTENS